MPTFMPSWGISLLILVCPMVSVGSASASAADLPRERPASPKPLSCADRLGAHADTGILSRARRAVDEMAAAEFSIYPEPRRSHAIALFEGCTYYDFSRSIPLAKSEEAEWEIREAVLYDYPRIISKYLTTSSLRPSLRKLVKRQLPPEALEMPRTLASRLRALEGPEQSSFLAMMDLFEESPGAGLTNIPLLNEMFRNNLYPELRSDFTSRYFIKSEFESIGEFMNIGRDLAEITRADGTIDLGELLKTRVLDLESDSGHLIREKSLSKNQVTSLAFTLLPDSRGHYRLRVAVLDTYPHTLNRGLMGNRHHSIVAREEYAEFAGELHLTDKGEIYALTLSSGHFMVDRADVIKGYFSDSVPNPDEFERFMRLAAKIDRFRIREILTRDLRLKLAPSSPENPLQIHVRENEWQHYLTSTYPIVENVESE